jgi:hypothetical protein
MMKREAPGVSLLGQFGGYLSVHWLTKSDVASLKSVHCHDWFHVG